MLARLLRSGDLTSVWVPDAELEALRDVVRAREAALADRLRATNRVRKQLLCAGLYPPAQMRPTTPAYQRPAAWMPLGRVRTLPVPHGATHSGPVNPNAHRP
jgi:transposase